MSNNSTIRRQPAERTGRHLGAFILGAPGTYVEERGDALYIGNRPGLFHRLIAVFFCGLTLAAWVWLHPPLWLVGVLVLTLCVPTLLINFNTQHFIAQRGSLRAAGRAAGIAINRSWAIPADSQVEVEERYPWDVGDPRPLYQAVIATDVGWIAVAESGDRQKAADYAGRLAAAVGVPLASSPQ